MSSATMLLPGDVFSPVARQPTPIETVTRTCADFATQASGDWENQVT